MTAIEGPSYEEQTIRVRTATGEHQAITFLVKHDAQRAGLWTSSDCVKNIVDGLRAHDAPPAYVERVIHTAIATNQSAASNSDDMRRAIVQQTEAIERLG